MGDTSVKSIARLVDACQQLARQAHVEYSCEVDAMIQGQCCDQKRIERLLDGILDFCFDSKMLRLYKNLCRYYFTVNPSATVSYIYAYRDMWDNDDAVS